MKKEPLYDARFLFPGFVLIVMGIIYFAVHHSKMINMEAASINQMLYDSNYVLDGDTILDQKYCSLTVNSSLGAFGEYRDSGIMSIIYPTAGTYYTVLLDDGSFMIVKVSRKKDIEKMNIITDETFESEDLYSKTTLTVKGKVVFQGGDDVAESYDLALNELGIDPRDKNNRVRYICLDASGNPVMLWGVFLWLELLGITAIFGGTIERLFKRIINGAGESPSPSNNKNEVKMSNDLKASSVPLPVDNFLGKGTVMDKAAEKPERFGDADRHERTADGKVSISGRDLIK